MKSLCTLVLCILATVPAPRPPRLPDEDGRLQPNFIVIVTDDHGYADLGCQGVREDLQTPNLDRLAEAGVRMTCGYVTAPECTPSRAGLLTGMYQNRFGSVENGCPLPGEVITIAERLRDAGYATGMVGKWHLGPREGIKAHGFEDLFHEGGSWRNFDLEGGDVDLGPGFFPEYHVDVESAAARVFIERHLDRPFFLYLAYRAPHVPQDPTESYLSRFPEDGPVRRRKALAMLAAVDDGVGGIMRTLETHSLVARTLIFVLGDHGAPLKIDADDPSTWNGSLNEPLNGEKKMLSEGGIRVPFLASWRDRIPAGLVYNDPVSSLDIAATLCAAAGLDAAPGLDGVDLVPHFRHEIDSPPHAELFWSWRQQAAIRSGRWKYIQAGPHGYLFDVEEDPGETHNRIASEPERADDMAHTLGRWVSQWDRSGARNHFSAWEERYFEHYLGSTQRVELPLPEVPGATATEEQRDRRRAQFARRDKDGDELLTWAEMIGKPRGLNPDSLRARFRELDTNRDGLLTLEEFCR